MKRAAKYQTQMNLFGEWVNGSPSVSGADVFCKRTGRVKQEWISDSKRALTQDLMAEVCELSNLAAACRQVVKNGGSPGVDGMTTRELKQEFMHLQQELREQLLNGSYRPGAVLGVEIAKPQGGFRMLGIPTVKDRLVQQAISQVLSKRYERIFSAYSFGFRPGRSAHQALKQAGEYVREGYSYAVDVDLEKFFGKVNHARLMSTLSRRIQNGKLLRLIRQFLQAGMLLEGLQSQRRAGTPQGSPLSPCYRT